VLAILSGSWLATGPSSRRQEPALETDRPPAR
jgi:hypothetical protein